MNQRLENRIYDILEQHGADPDRRFSFIHWFHEPDQREWRFIGTLGFGGKFIKDHGRYFVTCYPEDRNAAREEAIEQMNKQLATVVPEVIANA